MPSRRKAVKVGLRQKINAEGGNVRESKRSTRRGGRPSLRGGKRAI